MAIKPKDQGRTSSGLTQPDELYLPGDALPVPEVVEKDSDSVWALWSDTMEGDTPAGSAPADDFKDTVPMDSDSLAPTQLMDLPRLPNDPDDQR